MMGSTVALWAVLGIAGAAAIDSAYWNQYAIEAVVESCHTEVYLTREHGVETYALDLAKNESRIEELVAFFGDAGAAMGAPGLAGELLAGMRGRFFECAWDNWLRGSPEAAAGEAAGNEPATPEGAPLADGCVPFLSAYAATAGARTGPYRTVFSPHDQCAYPRQLFFHYNGGDAFAFEEDEWGRLPWNACPSVNFWLARFLGDWARRGGARGLVIDVGANVGQEAVLAASFGHAVVAYEPFPDTLATAAFNVMTNCVEGVDLRPFATGAAAGSACGDRGALGVARGSHAGDGVFADRILASQRDVVPDADGLCLNVTTLDAEVAAGRIPRERPLVLKIDNEGSEVATLRGAAALLARDPPLVLILEWLPFHHGAGGAADLDAFLKARGYFLYPLAPHDRSLRPTPATYATHDVLARGLPLRRAGGTPVAEMGPALWATALDVLALHEDLAAPGAGAALAATWDTAKRGR